MQTMITLDEMNMFSAYDAALAAGDLDTAFSIAYDNRDAFDWEGDYPEDWTPDQIAQHRGDAA